MSENPQDICSDCGKPSRFSEIQVLEVGGNVQETRRSFCVEHEPPGVRDKLPYGPIARPSDAESQLATDIHLLVTAIEDAKRRVGQAD